MNESYDLLAEASRLLVDIAGPESVHIEMSARGPKKYYEVHRMFDERDGRAHLLGWRTKGATLRHPGGMTRALCYDADTTRDWQLLQEAAWALAARGSTPLLEISPVGRGGHLWIIYTGLVCAAHARRSVLELASQLWQIPESWPGTGPRTLKVRLPAGMYVQPGFRQWCTLFDAHGMVLATDGRSAARVLLDYQTPVHVVQNTPLEAGTVGERDLLAPEPTQQETQTQCSKPFLTKGEVDAHWQKKYNPFLWFQFTPRQLAMLYNERHTLSDMLQLEKNGMAFSPSVPERTPSTAITGNGQAWVDFSAQSLQPDGKHDGGDALELAARRNGELKRAKSATLREAARMLVREARNALECAARAGDELPAWVAEILTEAGWQCYRSLCAEAARAVAGTSSRGVTGFLPAELTTHGAQESIAQRAVQATTGTHVVSHESRLEQDSLLALAADIRAQIGEPCSRCGCTLSYQSGPYRMCHQCYPRPAKFGRLTDEQWQRLRILFPRKPAPMGLSDLYRRKR